MDLTPTAAPPISPIRYNVPVKKDMAIAFVMFNPVKTVRMISNYLYTVEKLRLAGIPYFTMELLFPDCEPEFHDAIHVKCSSHLFHKERMCRLLEKKIPEEYTKILFADADLIFENPNWYSDVSDLLESHQVVHPFTTCAWLDITYKNIIRENKSAVFNTPNTWHQHENHPGFAWAFNREWYRAVGFYEYSVVGSGDCLSIAAWMNTLLPEEHVSQAICPSYVEYIAKMGVRPKLAAAPGRILHLWHGTREKRQYVNRHNIINHVNDLRTVITTNEDGCFELTDRVMSDAMYNYFKDREDDGI
jgi:hypothetical protein